MADSAIEATLTTLKNLKDRETETVLKIAQLRAEIVTQRAMLEEHRLRKKSMIASLNVLLSADVNEHIES